MGNLQGNQLGVLHFQEHTSYLSGQLGLLGMDLGVDGFTEHLLLLGWGSSVYSLEADASGAWSFWSWHSRCRSVLATATLTGSTHSLLHWHITSLVALAARSTHTLWWHSLHTGGLAATAATTELVLDLCHGLGIVEAVWHCSTLDGTHWNALTGNGEVWRNLLVGVHTTATLLSWESASKLARATSGHSRHDHSLCWELHSTLASVTGHKVGLLTGTVEDGLHELKADGELMPERRDGTFNR